ncbi:MAG: exonuclease subunit SbcD [Bacteroidetes bacterium]|uniref:Nuclease SbcCD subunit D n=1 Tax=Candidatus Cryptobacteroides merdavium TaxID=2840769 RepID=A0A9D9HB31_9BACT|nr:exonuclease subunit SbcD [Candidatus Cryptobacteroides merdavium]
MKILHTSDWHLGQIFYGYDRREEQEAFLRALAGVVGRERPDVMIVSGDVFHNSTPSAQAKKMYVDGMVRIHEACPEMTMVVTAGNHDSPSRLEAEDGLWRHVNVRVIGSFARREDRTADFSGHVVDVVRDGHVIGHVAAAPYASPRSFPEVTAVVEADGDEKTNLTGNENSYRTEDEGQTEDHTEDRMALWFRGLSDYVKGLDDGLPTVLSAHLAVAGSDAEGHDDLVGGMDYVGAELLGDAYSYVALGHIHKPQTFAGGRMRYSGSPIAVNFDESYIHSVTVVELDAGAKTLVRTVQMPDPVPLVTLPGKEPGELEAALDALARFPEDRPAYVRLNVLVRGLLPADSEMKAAELVRGKMCRYCCMKAVRAEDSVRRDGRSDFTVQEMREMDPLDVARIYFHDKNGSEMPQDMEDLLREAVRRARNVNIEQE